MNATRRSFGVALYVTSTFLGALLFGAVAAWSLSLLDARELEVLSQVNAPWFGMAPVVPRGSRDGVAVSDSGNVESGTQRGARSAARIQKADAHVDRDVTTRRP